MRIKLKNGETICVDSDTACRCAIDWSHRPGEFQRWYLRSLQEICDGRKQIDGWNEAEYLPDDHWSYAMEIGDGDQPSVCTKYADYANDGYDVTAQDAALFKRDIPMLHEYLMMIYLLSRVVRFIGIRTRTIGFCFGSQTLILPYRD